MLALQGEDVGKKKELMDIGRPRHYEFEMKLMRRFKDRPDIEPIVYAIEEQGADAEVQRKKNGTVLEAYELTNYDLFHFPTIQTVQKIKIEQKKTQQTLHAFTGRGRRKTLCYTSPYYPSLLPPALSGRIFSNGTLSNYMRCKISKENLERHIDHLAKYPEAKKYAVFSFGENLAEDDLWRYAENGVKVWIAGYQAQEWAADPWIGKAFADQRSHCGYRPNPQGVCDQCSASFK